MHQSSKWIRENRVVPHIWFSKDDRRWYVLGAFRFDSKNWTAAANFAFQRSGCPGA